MKLKRMQNYLFRCFLCEIITTSQQQYIEKRVIQMFIYTETLSCQYHGREDTENFS